MAKDLQDFKGWFKLSGLRQLVPTKPEQLESAKRLAVKAAVVVFLAYIAAATVSSLVVMFMISSALPTRPGAKAAGNVASISMGESVNYRDVKKEIMERNLFNSTGEFPKEEDPNAKQENGLAVFDDAAPCRKTSLNVDLLGTIYLGERGPSLATVQEKGFEQADVYRANDSIVGNDQARIHKIEQKRVVINNNGVKECLELLEPTVVQGGDNPSSPAAAGGTAPEVAGGAGENCGNIVLEESYVTSQLGDGFATILSKGRLIPHSQDNQMIGFKLIGVDQGSLFGKVCLKNGDVITQVNETSLQQAEQGFALYQAFQDERELRISLLRQGKTPMTINVQIK